MHDPTRNGLPENAPTPRFYKSAAAGQAEGGVAPVLLDGRPIRTPAKALLATPPHVAERIAAEWQAQEKHIRPLTMPLTRLANTAIDGVANAVDAVRSEIATMAGNDLVYYRADWPEALAERQALLWDPVVTFGAARYGVDIKVTTGVMPVHQDDALVPAVAADCPTEPLPLAALHQLTTLTGSALMALQVLHGGLAFEEAWEAAHVDEDWNAAEWGEDAEAAARRAQRRLDAEAAALLLTGADPISGADPS